MTPDALIAHFGTAKAVADALGVKPPSVSEWKAKGSVPIGRQFQAEVLTDGQLRAERESTGEAA